MGWASETFGPTLLVKTDDGIKKVDTDAHVASKKLLALYFSAHVRRRAESSRAGMGGAASSRATGRSRVALRARTRWRADAGQCSRKPHENDVPVPPHSRAVVRAVPQVHADAQYYVRGPA